MMTTHVSLGSAVLNHEYANWYDFESGPTSHTVVISKKTLNERGEAVATSTSPYDHCTYEGCNKWDYPEFDNRIVVVFTDPLHSNKAFGVSATMWTKYKPGKNCIFLRDLVFYRKDESTFCSYFTLTEEEIVKNDYKQGVMFRFDCSVYD
jgi:hypothetical protein